MTRLALTALEVANCGPWQGRHRFEFPSRGLAVFCAPNETGKTTLLRLVAAVIWGFETPSQNWFAQDGAYGAVLEYERMPRDSDSVATPESKFGRFRISRDFRNDKVTIWREENGQWQSLRATQHRFRGRTADSEQWTRLVQDLFAPISPEAFVRLALLASPFDPQPEGQLVQSLISGAGVNTRDEALETLLKRHREITRFSRRANISNADARKDGRLDELRQKRDQLQSDITTARQVLDEGLRLREEIGQLEREIAAREKEIQEVEKDKEVLDEVRRLARECAMKQQREEPLKHALKTWKELNDRRRQVSQQLEKYPALLRDSLPDRRDQWKKTLEELQRRAEDLWENSAEVKEAALRKDFADVWNWPEDAESRVAQIQRATEVCKQADERVREAVSRLAAVRPVVDRRRQIPVSVTAAVAVVAVVFLIFSLLGYPVVGVLVAGLCGLVGGWIVAQLYRPECWPPERAECERLAKLAEEERQRASGELQKLWDDVLPWAQTREWSDLLRLLGRFQSLSYAKDSLAQEKAKLEDLARRLRSSALPRELQELCRLAVGGALPEDEPLSPKVFRLAVEVLNKFDSLIKEDDKLKQQQETPLKSTGAGDIHALEEASRNAELDLQGSVLERSQLKARSPLAEEAFSWDNKKLEGKYRALEEELKRLKENLKESQQKRNERETELARWEGQNVVNVAQSREELVAIEREIEVLEKRAEAIAKAYELVEKAYRTFSQAHHLAIQNSLNDLMRSWTGRRNREFILDENFAVTFRDIDSQRDKPADWGQLSQGACDQLALAIRWAVLDRVAGDVVLPLLLDDCFHMWDAQRRECLRQFFQEHTDRQMILVTHDEDFLSWGQPISHKSVDL
ncbi:MAG: AAA family ATPase [Thermogutta sp.]